MGRLDDMKRAAANKPVPTLPKSRPPKPKAAVKPLPKAAPAPPATSKPEPTPKGEKPVKVEAVGDYITHACSHRVGLAHFRGSKCPSCSRQPKHKLNFATAAPAHADKRLPDGSVFAIDPFRAETPDAPARWSGTLTVPGFPPFAGTNSGLWPLLRYLDRLYREAKRAAEDPADKPAE